MINIENPNKIYLFIICFIIKVAFSKQSFHKYEMKININQDELNNFYFEENDYNCKKWVPSLFNPILLAPRDLNIIKGERIMNICKVKDVLLNDNEYYLLEFYTHIYFFN